MKDTILEEKMQEKNLNDKKIVFIGAGNMAEAMIKGILEARLINKKHIIATDIKKERLEYIYKQTGIVTFLDNQKAQRSADIIVLSVKPQVVKQVLSEIGENLLPRQLIISIAAGVTTSYIEKYINKNIPLIRAMPNISVLIRQGVSAICRGKYARLSHEQMAERILGSVGKVIKCQEEVMDAVTALSGSGPAYLFYILEILIEAGKEMGLSEEVSQTLSKQTVLGAIELVNKRKIKPAELRKRVTSPGGTTEQALEYLKEKHFAGILIGAIKRAKKRAEELSK